MEKTEGKMLYNFLKLTWTSMWIMNWVGKTEVRGTLSSLGKRRCLLSP